MRRARIAGLSTYVPPRVLTNADLDECHGHTHTITWDGKAVVMYHYHATREFPYTVGCFRGASPARTPTGG